MQKEEIKSLFIIVKEESKKLASNLAFKNQDHDIWSHPFMVNRWGKSGNSDIFSFLGLPSHCEQ